ncbi:MAG TPA: hypothetical protein VNJ08_11435 [Bacteriovoracaceae bacterium]|nr:hypothetical protein [Bacteriovoracaceae bacterium]
MKRFFFLPSEVSYGLLGLTLLCLVKLNFEQAFFILTMIFMVAFAFRRGNIPYRETLKPDGEIYISPVHGTVESIRQNVPILNDSEIGHEVRISISIWDEKGLYLPTTGEVSYLKANKGKKIPRDAEPHVFYGPLDEVSHTDLVFTSKNQAKTLMRYVDGQCCTRPTIWLKSGDRGRGAACFGYYPFGGTLLIYLPKNSDLLVYEAERVKPGQTVIASIKDEK